MKEQIICLTEKCSEDGKTLGMKYLRLEKIGGEIANTITTHIPELSIQHCNLVIEIERIE